MNKFPLCVIIYLTDFCPLQCKHCFLVQNDCINKHKIDFDCLRKTLEELRENNVYMIAFTGGDPLLHPDLYQILKYTSNLDMLPLLGISGIGINQENAMNIYNSGVRCVQIGFNGSYSDLNDEYRGSGTFKQLKMAVLTLQNNGLNVNLSFCLDKNNYRDLNNMLDFSNKLNAYKVKIEFWKSMSNSTENELSQTEMINVYNNCVKYMDKFNKKDWIQCPKCHSDLVQIHHSAIVIMPNGDIKYNEVSPALGNIYHESITDIINRNGDEKNNGKK